MAKISDFICADVPGLTAASAWYPAEDIDPKDYLFTSRFGDTVSLCRENGKYTLLPRALCPVGDVDERVDGYPVQFRKTPAPRDYQKAVFDKTSQFIKAGESGIVCARTGWGKTLLGYHAAATLGVKTLVVTTKEDIFLQWMRGAVEFLGCKPTEVGEIRQGKCEVLDAQFCVALVQSLSKDEKYPPEAFKDFGLLIIDEVHRMAADAFSEVMWMIPAKVRLGLSATPYRSDGKDVLLRAHIGPIRAEAGTEGLVPKVLLFNSGWQCPRRPKMVNGKRVWLRVPHAFGKTALVEKILAGSVERNAMIGEMIFESWKKGRNLVVFSTTHAHLAALMKHANDLGVPLDAMGHYRGATTKAEKAEQEACQSKPVVFTTYVMMAEGTDWPWLDTCILAMPRANIKQPVGRIRREYADKKFLVVCDVVDADSEVLAAYAQSRIKWYREIGAEYLWMTEEPEEETW